jgi:hypothetical protein
MLTISETLDVNAIFWVRSLPDEELGLTRRITDELTNLSNRGGWDFFEKVVENRNDLLEALAELARNAEAGLRPIIHFDAHGSKDDGLFLTPSEEFLGWEELADALRAINIATQNNLICVFATCFAYYFNFQVELKKPTPSYLIMAPAEEIRVGFLEDQTALFYTMAFESGNLTEAFRLTLGAHMTLYHCQGIFAKALSRYVRSFCQGKAKQARQERLLSRFLTENDINDPSPEDLKKVRQLVKTSIKPSQKIIDYYAPKFLICREPAFCYEDLEKLVQRS